MTRGVGSLRKEKTKTKGKAEPVVELENVEVAATNMEYIDNTVLIEYDKTYDNHELYSK